MKKNRAVVFGLSANQVFAVACVMMDIKKLSPDLADEIVIIHDGINEQDKNILQNILPTKFIDYDFPLKKKEVLDAKAIKYFTKMVFTKFECLRLLNDYRNVMWLDYDIVVQEDIGHLFLPSENGIKMMLGGIPVRGQLHEEVLEYDMDKEGIVGSLFVFQDNLKNYLDLYKYCYMALEKYVNVLHLGEQAIFDFMLQEFKLQPIFLDGEIYTPHPTNMELAKKAKIIHAYGQPKFWNGLEHSGWNENYKKWLELGGTPCKNKNNSFFYKIKRLINSKIFTDKI